MIKSDNSENCKCYRIADLRKCDLALVPAVPGVYVVYRKDPGSPRFAPKSTGGWFRGKDPTVQIKVLADKWVKNARVLYVGKAGGSDQKSTLRGRIKSFIDFGLGVRSAHWGGRYIWQLEDAGELFLCWRCTGGEPPDTIENYLIQSFFDRFGKLPFANLIRGVRKAFPSSNPQAAGGNLWSKCLEQIFKNL